MERLWAAWRMAYVAQASKPGGRGRAGTRGRRGKAPKRAPCLFCAFARKRPSARSLLLETTPLALVVLNLYPYNVAHLMVAPRRHVASPASLTDAEALEITRWLGALEGALKREYKPHGFNLGVNLGRPAGAGVLGHLHWHVVPRWNGDTNFMPVTAGVKVLPESLDRTYGRVKRALDRAPRRRAR